MRRLTPQGLMLLWLTACTHSDSYTFTAPVITSFPGGADVQLTYNVDQDYWPAWTQDGRAILYAYVDEQFPQHRCLGLLSPAGGTRRWSLCDNRAVRRDTLSSYSAFALDTAGQLLVAEVTTANSLTPLLPLVTLWLADTAQPYRRIELLRLPVQTADGPVTWLSDLLWTSPTTFMALGQTFGTATELGHPTDTVFTDGGLIVEGTIADGRATLRSIAGTDSASGYSLADDGNTIVFTRRHDLRLVTVPRSGGVPSPPPIIRTVPDSDAMFVEAVGLSCKGSICLVAEDRILTNGVYTNVPALLCMTMVCQAFGMVWDSPPGPGLPHTLHRISLSTGTDEVVASGGPPFATPVISPVNDDVVVQVAGMWGHLQTRASVSVNGDLHLLQGLLH